MANELSTNFSEIIQFIVINIGDEQYGIDIKYIDNIVRMQNITRVPKVPCYLKGVINLRGEVIPVMSLRLKMDLEDDEITKDTRIIIIKLDQHEPIGIIVDSVREVVNIDMSLVEKVGLENRDDTSYVQGIGKQGEALISLLDLNAVLQE
ncbi:MAG: chemotaxis protein CheW [Lachnospiraceae bacterium]|nr:chemotaxis protein CheW [Lachnospiraceae bacterium]MBQ8262072.1 chemotaxis protein CheW [Lachnospiraceae bacterium]